MENEVRIAGMGERIASRMKELEIGQTELANKVSDLAERLGLAPLNRKTLSAAIKRKSDSTGWSDLIAEVLEVNHRWLQCGVGPKERSHFWPFPSIDHSKVCALRQTDRDRLEGALVAAADHFGLDIGNAAA